MIKNILIVVALLILSISCNDSPVDPADESFILEVTVTDLNNNPLSGINVSIWNKIDYQNNLSKDIPGNMISASTSIRFTVPQKKFVDLSMYDLNGNLNERLIDNQLSPGQYMVTYVTQKSNGVQICRLTASSDSLGSDIIFQDSIYIVEISPDPAVSLIGKTGSNGKFTTTDKLMFPNLFDLPPLPFTSSESPEILGYFEMSDTVIIALSDESFSRIFLYEYCIKDGVNKPVFKLYPNFSNTENFSKKLKETYNLNNIDSVEYLDFHGFVDDDDIVLNWQTAFEINNSGFEIERSSNNEIWITMGFVQGSGSTNESKSYSFTDKNVPWGIYYYRLKQIDFDGKFSYSNEIEIGKFTPMNWSLEQNYPNPFN